MRALREQDFDQMAERVVDRFMGGAKLADVAAAEAQDAQLNPDQVARLAHAANTMAFLRLMEQQKAQGGHDMTSEFDPVDARQIIMHLIQDAGGAVGAPPPDGMPSSAAPADGDHMPLPDETGAGADHDDAPPIDDDNDGPFPKGSKDKASKKDDKKDKKKPPGPPQKDEAKEAAFRARRMRKLADILDDQYLQAELAFEDDLAKLGTLLKRASGAPSMEAFEKDALATHGDDVGIVVLNLVRGERGMPALEFDSARQKTASLADRHVVADTETSRTFDRLVKIASEALRLQRGAAHARSLCS